MSYCITAMQDNIESFLKEKMTDFLLCENVSLGHNIYGGDFRLLNSVLSATGFESIDFEPVNVDSTTLLHGRRKRRRVVRDGASHPHGQRFECGSCSKTFSEKKSRDRHLDSVHNRKGHECFICFRVFTRKDMRTRHQNEKHGGRKRSRSNASKSSAVDGLPPPNFETTTYANDDPLDDHQASNSSDVLTSEIPNSPMYDQYVDLEKIEQPPCNQYLPLEEADEEIVGPPRDPDSMSPLQHIDPGIITNALLLCTDLLIRCKPYKRFFIHNKKRDIISRKKWRDPHIDYYFCKLYDSAVRKLQLEVASNKKDAECLAALAAFMNVDVLIHGAERMGHHAKAMYYLKAHHRARRDPIFDALETAFLSLGKKCRSIRIIYTKNGFVWMLNMGYRCLTIPID